MDRSSKSDNFWRSYGVLLFTKKSSWFWPIFADLGPKSADVITFFEFSWCFLKILMKMSVYAKIHQSRIFPSENIRVVQICRLGFWRPPEIRLKSPSFWCISEWCKPSSMMEGFIKKPKNSFIQNTKKAQRWDSFNPILGGGG